MCKIQTNLKKVYDNKCWTNKGLKYCFALAWDNFLKALVDGSTCTI